MEGQGCPRARLGLCHRQHSLPYLQPVLAERNAHERRHVFFQSGGCERGLEIGDDLADSPRAVVVTISDFGRTPSANLSLGTDHGSASTAFVLGDMVKGGVYGDYPSLKTFDSTGNLAVNVDFRNMLSDVIVALGGNATTVLGKTYPKLGFI